MKTWVIVLIVLAVLVVVGITVTGILATAAIVVPQFTGASHEAKESSLVSELQAMRAQIELYKIQHNDNLPGKTAGVDFETAMTSKTNRGGEVGITPDHRYGPYIRKIPTNYFNDLDTVDVSGMGTIGDDSHGWDFNPITGDFNADDSAKRKRWTQ